MSLDKLNTYCASRLDELKAKGVEKGAEKVIAQIALPDWVKHGRLPSSSEDKSFGPRCYLAGNAYGYLIMNSNSYLGLTVHPKVMAAEEEGVQNYGTGPGAVRFISGTFQPHIELEERLAAFHGRESAMIYSSAYATVMGVIPALIDDSTLVVSDQLNHNCIINAIRLAHPAKKEVYRHLDLAELERILSTHASQKSSSGEPEIKRVLVITDGIFSMRGDFAPLDAIAAICRKYEQNFAEGIITIADDSHGVGAFGKSGRGTEEYTQCKADILIATLGKALGVNGGYVVASSQVIHYLRETSPFYIYSNPITPSEALAAKAALEIIESEDGLERLARLRKLTAYFEKGLTELGFETIPGEHPVTPLVLRDTRQTALLIEHLFENKILATGLNYPVVPKGDEEIRFQINANHTTGDIDYLLDALKNFLVNPDVRS